MVIIICTFVTKFSSPPWWTLTLSGDVVTGSLVHTLAPFLAAGAKQAWITR